MRHVERTRIRGGSPGSPHRCTSGTFAIAPTWIALRWLEDPASRGYRLVRSCNPVYVFERAEPESVRFCHGFGRVRSGDRDEYLQLYADAGWQHVSSWIGWHYFKSGVATASTTDRVIVTQDNAKSLRRAALFYRALLIVYCAWLLLLWNSFPITNRVSFYIASAIGVGGWAFGYLILSYAAKRQLANAEKLQN